MTNAKRQAAETKSKKQEEKNPPHISHLPFITGGES
jgi:hypothetical protein